MSKGPKWRVFAGIPQGTELLSFDARTTKRALEIMEWLREAACAPVEIGAYDRRMRRFTLGALRQMVKGPRA